MNCSVSNEYHLHNLTSAITVPLFTSNNGPFLLVKSCKFISIYCFFDTSSPSHLSQNVILLCKLWEILPCAVRYKINSNLKVQAKSQPNLFKMMQFFPQQEHFSTFLCAKIKRALTNLLLKMNSRKLLFSLWNLFMHCVKVKMEKSI